MARAGIYKSEVLRARDRLVSQGKYPSIDAVRVELGNTGSKVTIHRYLKEIEDEEATATAPKISISDELAELVGRLSTRLEFDANATFAIGGADALVTLSGLKVEPYRAYHASAGQSLTTESLTAGRFLYICFAGGVDCERVMNSMSTYVPGGFGGIGGRRLATGDTISVGDVKRRVRAQVSDPLPDNLRPSMHSGIIRYVPRDSSDSFTGTFLVSAASDRTGYRLEGAVLIEGASVTSEAVCPGAIQLPPGGELIVLMADAPTIGGYRIMGAVIGADMGRLSQRLPGEAVQLIPVSVHQAQRELAARREMVERIREWALA